MKLWAIFFGILLLLGSVMLENGLDLQSMVWQSGPKTVEIKNIDLGIVSNSPEVFLTLLNTGKRGSSKAGMMFLWLMLIWVMPNLMDLLHAVRSKRHLEIFHQCTQ